MNGEIFDVNFRFGMIGRSENDNFMTNDEKQAEKEFETGYGCPKLISHEEIVNEDRGLIVYGAVTFFCDVNEDRRLALL